MQLQIKNSGGNLYSYIGRYRVNEQEGMCKEAEAFTGVCVDGMSNNTTAVAWAKLGRAPRPVDTPGRPIIYPLPLSTFWRRIFLFKFWHTLYIKCE